MRGRWLGVLMGALVCLVGCTEGDPEPGEPSDSSAPTSVTSPSPQETDEPSATPQTEEEQAVAEAIEIYKAFLHASHLSTSSPDDEERLQAVLLLTTPDGPIRDAIAAETQYLRDNDIRLEGEPIVKRVNSTNVELSPGIIWLASCLDLSELRATNSTEAAPSSFVEDIELHLVDGRWLVHYIDGREAPC